MGTVLLDMAMSLDGFIAGVNDADIGLHNWFFSQDRGKSDPDQQVIDESLRSTGALILGRRTYDLGVQYDGFVDNPYQVPHFVLTHHVPDQPAKGNTDFVFVTDGIESALEQAQLAAGEKNVAVGGGASNAQQFLKAGLIDEMLIHLAPVIAGDGVRLFDRMDEVRHMETIKVIPSSTVTHLRLRIMK